jgi:hypothetical protein
MYIEAIDAPSVFVVRMTPKDLLKLWVTTRDEALAAVLESAIHELKNEPRVVVVLEVETLKAPYPFCRHPEKCAGKGYCPCDPACND